MKPEKFKIIKFSKELIVDIDNYLDNFPRKDLELKNKIKNTAFEMLEEIYIINTITDKEEKIKLLYKVIAKIKFLDFLLNFCYDKQIINYKRYTKFGNKMDDILKYVSGWLKVLLQ